MADPGPQSAEQVAIVEKVQSFWDDSTMGPIVYPNDNYVPPPGSVRTTLDIEHPQGGRTRESIGKEALIQQLGFVTFVCHLPAGGGKLRATSIADIISEQLDEAELVSLTGCKIQFRIASSSSMGVKDGTYRLAIIVPFRRQQIK